MTFSKNIYRKEDRQQTNSHPTTPKGQDRPKRRAEEKRQFESRLSKVHQRLLDINAIAERISSKMMVTETEKQIERELAREQQRKRERDREVRREDLPERRRF